MRGYNIIKNSYRYCRYVCVYLSAIRQALYQAPRRLLSREGEAELLGMAGLCVVDGYLLSMLLSGSIEEPFAALIFGMTAFSGVGCITIAATCLRGGMKERMLSVTKVYAVVAVGALPVSVFYSLMSAFIIPEMKFVTVAVVGLIGMIVSGVERLRSFAMAVNPKRVFAAGFSLSVFASLLDGIDPVFALDIEAAGWVLLAVTVGYLATLAASAAGRYVSRVIDERSFRLTAGATLMALSMSIAGLPVTPEMVGILFISGCIMSFSIGTFRSLSAAAG